MLRLTLTLTLTLIAIVIVVVTAIVLVIVLVIAIVICEAVPDRQSYYLNSNINNFLFSVPKCNPLPFCTTFIPSPVVANLNKSGVANKAALGFLLAGALPILLAISNALSGLIATFFQS